MAAACHVGNVFGVARLRKLLARHPDRFPRLLGQVLFSGTHCGDHIPAEELDAFEAEMDLLDGVADDADECVRQFQVDFGDVVDVARELGKPISF